jgi:hypothetical protein
MYELSLYVTTGACLALTVYFMRLIWAGEIAFRQIMTMVKSTSRLPGDVALRMLAEERFVDKYDNHTKAIFWRKDPRSLYSEECVRLLWPKATPRVSA